ncbi:MAG: CdaR family protein [Oscillospiraceae bacterium]
MKIKFSFSKLLDNDKFVRLLAVFVAIISWFIVSWTIDPTAIITINDIPIVFDLTATTPESYDLSVIEGIGQTVDIKVEGKNYKIGNLTAEDFIAIPTLSSVTKPGEYTLDIEVKKVNARDDDYNVIPSYSSKVKAYFDYVREATFNLEATAENITAEEGYVKEIVLSSPNKLTLKGPQLEINKIGKCVVETDSSQVASDILVLDGKLVFYDHENAKIKLKNITYQQQNFEVTVQIYKHKTVPFTVNFINSPPGLDQGLLQYTFSEDTIEISGPKETIDNIDQITLGEIDFRKVNIGSVFALDVNLPAGIVNVNSTNLVTVSVNSIDLDKTQLSITNIIPMNIPAAYNVKVTTKVINNVKMVGNTVDIDTLSSNDLIARVDLQSIELSDGSQRVPVTIYSTGNKFVWAVGEYTVLVNATKR